MSNTKITVEVVESERGIERAIPPRPQPRDVKSLFDGMTIPMPEKHPVPPPSPPPPSPPPPSVDEVVPRPAVEVLTPEDLRHQEQRKPPPAPEAILETTPTAKPSLVPHVEVNCEAMLGFLTALARIAPMESTSLLSSVKLTYKTEEKNRLYLEASNAAMWALIVLEAEGGGQEFSAVIPLQRSINILKYLRGESERLLIGLDNHQLHLGPLSLPFAGDVADFPGRLPLHTVEARAIVPAYYFEEVNTRLTPVLGSDLGHSSSSGIHIDFARQTAVASDGDRYHLLSLPRMHVESRLASVLPPAVTVAPEFFFFLAAVVDRDWTAMQINANQISAAGEDYAVVSRCAMGHYEDWRSQLRDYRGAWVFDKAALLEKLVEGQSEDSDLVLRLDASQETGSLTFTTSEGRQWTERITAKRYDGAPAIVKARLELSHVIEAVEMCQGGLVRLMFDDCRGATTEPMLVQGEDPNYTAIVPTREVS